MLDTSHFLGMELRQNQGLSFIFPHGKSNHIRCDQLPALTDNFGLLPNR